jgi:hypothetical protein
MRETSLIEWCEPRNSLYVAEFYNSWSNAFFLISAAASYWNHGFANCNAAMFVVGLGSFWFHATQSYIGELFDEFPMSVLMYLYYEAACANANIHVYRETYLTFAVIGWSYYLYNQSHEFFTNMFTIQLLIPVYIIITKTTYDKRRMFVALCTIGLAKASWNYERHLFATNQCPEDETSPLYYLHSLWHVGSALAHYLLMSIL